MGKQLGEFNGTERERVLLLENFFNIKGKHIDVSNVESVTSINNLKLEI